MPALLGIDLGTSSVKVVLTAGDGTVLTGAAGDYPVDRPAPGRAETDPRAWWDAVVRATREVAGAAGVAPAAVGFSGQMHGVVLCTGGATPVRPAVLWSDARATAELDAYRALPAAVRRRLGNPLVPGMAGPVLAHLVRHEPDAVAAAVRAGGKALHPKDWLRARLTGALATEPSDASAGLLWDVVGSRFSEPVVAALGIPPELLPDVLDDATAAAGTLLPEAAAELGLPAGIPVVAGAADTAAALLGGGRLPGGTAQLTIGSGTQLVATAAVPQEAELPDRPVTQLHHGALAGSWYAMAATLNGGLALDWVRRVHRVSWQELYDAADAAPRADDPVFLPHLDGERTPWLDPGLTGSWVGLTTRHDLPTVLRAALTGVASAIADALDALPGVRPAVVRLAGGGSVHPAWRRLLSDVLDVPLDATEVTGLSAVGAALTAAPVAGAGTAAGLEARPAVPAHRVAEPRPRQAALLRERRAHAGELRARLRAAD